MGVLWGFHTAILITDYGNYKYPKELIKDTSHNV
jgi:hypothetical protein